MKNGTERMSVHGVIRKKWRWIFQDKGEGFYISLFFHKPPKNFFFFIC